MICNKIYFTVSFVHLKFKVSTLSVSGYVDSINPGVYFPSSLEVHSPFLSEKFIVLKKLSTETIEYKI